MCVSVMVNVSVNVSGCVGEIVSGNVCDVYGCECV